MSSVNRRSFLKTGALAAAGAAVRGLAAETAPASGAITMKYRTLGRTGLTVSEIGMGGSPAPSAPVFGFCVRNGVNWFDTSSGYEGGGSEKKYGEYLAKVDRSKMVISTKVKLRGNTTKQEILDQVAGSLERLGVKRIDILQIHGLGSAEQLDNPAFAEACDELKKQGTIGFTGFSIHGNTLELLPKAIEKNYHDVILVAFNVYKDVSVKHDDALREHGVARLLEEASKKGIGVLAMKAQAGGDSQKLDSYLREGVTAGQAKIMWALSHPFLSGVVTEMETIEMAAEDCRAPQLRLSSAVREDLYRYCREDSREYCRMCGACSGVCPSGVRISDIQRYLRYSTRYNGAKGRHARESYKRIPSARSARACTGCGKCEAVCPWGVAVRANLRRAAALLGESSGSAAPV